MGGCASFVLRTCNSGYQCAQDRRASADFALVLVEVSHELRANEALWLQTLLIISYDEHGGFYDHVVPPTAEIRALLSANTLAATSNFKAALTTPYGVRVPAFVVSPWVAAGKGPDITLDHCSILKTILARFCGATKPFLSDRVNASLSFNAFLTQAQPRLGEIPPSPSLPSLMSLGTNPRAEHAAIATKRVSRRERWLWLFRQKKGCR